MSSLTAIARATSMLALGATSLFAQVDRRAIIQPRRAFAAILAPEH